MLRISGPFRVMAMSCSNWAERPPSLVRTVQPSASTRHLWLPVLRMGSMVMVMPGSMRKPVPAFCSANTTWGSSCRSRPRPWPMYSRTTE